MTGMAAILAALATRPASRRRLEGGSTLFRAGERVRAIHVITAGRLRLVRTTIGGRMVTLQRASAGEAIAEASLFSDRYHCDAVADTASEVLAYSKPAVLQALRDRPDNALALLRHLALQVQAGRFRAEILTMRTADERLMSYFHLHLPAGADTLQIDQSWKELASELGLTHEALYRCLARLERERRIVRNDRRVRLTGR